MISKIVWLNEDGYIWCSGFHFLIITRKRIAISILCERDQFHYSELRLIKPTSIVLLLISCPLFTFCFVGLVPIVVVKIVHQFCFTCIFNEERLSNCVLNFV